MMIQNNMNVIKIEKNPIDIVTDKKVKKKKKKSKRCTNCNKKKGAYLLLCKCCNNKYCISCLDVNIHSCTKIEKYF